jgi:adenylate cyclase
MNKEQPRQRLAAILAADAVGYSILMAEDDRATLAALDTARAVFRAQIESAGGRVIDTAGDSVLASFETATGSVSAAIAIQRKLASPSRGTRAALRLTFRIGVHLGDVLEKTDGSVYGDGVNVAARLQSLCEPGSFGTLAGSGCPGDCSVPPEALRTAWSVAAIAWPRRGTLEHLLVQGQELDEEAVCAMTLATLPGD